MDFCLLGRFGRTAECCFCIKPSYWFDVGHTQGGNYSSFEQDPAEVATDVEPVSPELKDRVAIR